MKLKLLNNVLFKVKNDCFLRKNFKLFDFNKNYEIEKKKKSKTKFSVFFNFLVF